MTQNVQLQVDPKTDDMQAKSAAKPHVARVVLPDGTVRLVGVSAAARWLGCSQQALGQVVRGRIFCGVRFEARARAEFPGLFGDV